MAGPTTTPVCAGEQAARQAPGCETRPKAEEGGAPGLTTEAPWSVHAAWPRGSRRQTRRGILNREATLRGHPCRHGRHLFCEVVESVEGEGPEFWNCTECPPAPDRDVILRPVADGEEPDSAPEPIFARGILCDPAPDVTRQGGSVDFVDAALLSLCGDLDFC